MNKEIVISELTRSRNEILDLLEDITQEQMDIPSVIQHWSLKDLLVHLTRWEAELVKLLWQVKQGKQPTTIHFDQDETDAINERWYQESKDRAMDIVWKDFVSVREQTIRRVKFFSESELNDHQLYKWLKGRPLWEWIAEDSYKHEAEHAEHIRDKKEGMDKTA